MLKLKCILTWLSGTFSEEFWKKCVSSCFIFWPITTTISWESLDDIECRGDNISTLIIIMVIWIGDRVLFYREMIVLRWITANTTNFCIKNRCNTRACNFAQKLPFAIRISGEYIVSTSAPERRWWSRNMVLTHCTVMLKMLCRAHDCTISSRSQKRNY